MNNFLDMKLNEVLQPQRITPEEFIEYISECKILKVLKRSDKIGNGCRMILEDGTVIDIECVYADGQTRAEYSADKIPEEIVNRARLLGFLTRCGFDLTDLQKDLVMKLIHNFAEKNDG